MKLLKHAAAWLGFAIVAYTSLEKYDSDARSIARGVLIVIAWYWLQRRLKELGQALATTMEEVAVRAAHRAAASVLASEERRREYENWNSRPTVVATAPVAPSVRPAFLVALSAWAKAHQAEWDAMSDDQRADKLESFIMPPAGPPQVNDEGQAADYETPR